MPTPPTIRRGGSPKHDHHKYRCAADCKPRTLETEATDLPWELHIGFSRLSILGPGDNQWFHVSPPYYTGQVGTDSERLIAARAVAILNAEHPNNRTADAEIIAACLRRSAQIS